MSKHTPGPWAVGPDLEVFYALNGVGITRPLKLTSMAGRTEEDRANARLIAAAPEMLEALQDLLNDVGKASSMLGAVKARAAIAKARGNRDE
jgi:alkylhydroperoxidase family enzyme